MSKYTTKEPATHTVDKDVLKEFNELTKKKLINRSALVESFMINWIKENK